MHYIMIVTMILLLAGQVFVSRQLWLLLPLPFALKLLVVGCMALALLCILLPFLGVFGRVPLRVTGFIYELGTSWIIILMYLAILLFVLKVLQWTGLIPSSFLNASWIGTTAVTLIISALFVYARLHYEDKRRVEISVDSRGRVSRPLRLVLTSDLHLGYHNKRSDLHRWLGLIEDESPDALLIAGDIIDGYIRPVREADMAEEFRTLPFPVYACLGNHDYHTGIRSSIAFCEEAGLRLLRDEADSLGGLLIIGRDDRSNHRRKTLQQLVQPLDHSKYLLLLDHQPFSLEEAEQNGVDFEFCGHTHHGQVWPISWITDLIFEDAFGPLTKGATQYYVSSGLGIWGAKFRIGTRSEYIVLNIS